MTHGGFRGFKPGSQAREKSVPQPDQTLDTGYVLGEWVDTRDKETQFGLAHELVWHVTRPDGIIVAVTELSKHGSEHISATLVKRLFSVNGIDKPIPNYPLDSLKVGGYAMLFVQGGLDVWPKVVEAYAIASADRVKYGLPPLTDKLSGAPVQSIDPSLAEKYPPRPVATQEPPF